MLKSLGDRDIAEEYEETISPMGFLHKNLPFEFLISRFSFLQGLRCTPVRPMAWLAAAVFTLSCKYFYEAIMAEDDDEDHGKRE